MRIIKGQFAGKAILPPNSTLTRPTSEKVRQAIFNVIEHNQNIPPLQGSHVLDVFAGTGSLGLEALSRGAEHVTFVDHQSKAIFNLYNIVNAWDVRHKITGLSCDVLKLPACHKGVDIVFCDPPYKKNLVNLSITYLKHMGWIHHHSIIIAEMHKQEDLDASLPVTVLQQKRYGDTKVLFLQISDISTVKPLNSINFNSGL